MIPFYKRSINIDAGNKCTLECAACVRQHYKKRDKSIPGKDLTPLQFDKLTDYFKEVSFCGTFSDPIFNTYFFDILKICKKKNIKTEISTAASQRPIRWYKNAFDAYDKAVWIFGIDGLPKDSHKYRIHQNGEYLFDIMLMAKYQNIPVQWQYIVFDYNKENMKEAQQIAKTHKIPLTFIFSHRNVSLNNKNIKNIEDENKVKNIINKKETKILYKSSTISDKKENKLNPKCLLTSRALSFSNTGHVLPCCWLNTCIEEKGVENLFDNKNHIDNNTVENIINSKDWNDFFETLKNNPSKAPLTCKRFCSNNVNDNPEETKIRYENNLL